MRADTPRLHMRRKAVFLTLPGLLLLAVWFIWSQQRRTPTEVVRQALSCLETQDAECLFDLSNPSEMAEAGLSREAFARLCHEYVFAGPWVIEGKPIVRPSGQVGVESGSIMVSQAGGLLSFGALASDVDGQARLVGVIPYLVLARMPPLDGQIDDPLKQRVAWIRRDKEKLEALGLKGMYRGPGEPIMLWDDWEAHYSNPPKNITPADHAD